MPIIDASHSSDSSSPNSHSESQFGDFETGTSTSTHNDAADKQNDEKRIQIAKKESETIFRLRLLVFLVLLFASLAVSLVVYYITAGALQDEYEAQYSAAAEKVTEAFNAIADAKLSAIASLGVAVIAHGIDHKRHWPFVTISSFQQRSATARSQSGALDIKICPLVTDSDKEEWETFVDQDSAAWVQEGMDYQDDAGVFDFMKHINASLLVSNQTSPDHIWYYNDDHVKMVDPGPGPYLPVWETSPIFSKGQRANENMKRLNISGSPYQAVEAGHVVVSEFVMAPAGHMGAAHQDTSFFALLLSNARQQVVEYKGDPMSLISFPIFDSFENDRKTVAAMVAWVNWGMYFEDVLPDTVHGIVMVLSDGCGGVYTYELFGEQVALLGEGDLHDTSFNDKRVTAAFQRDHVIHDGTMQGVKLYQRVCHIEIEVYPSSEFYDSYKTNTPMVITFSVAIIFVFTAFMFLVYDRLVERRQALVLQKAVQSTAIVTSLFPEQVRDRLLNTAPASNTDKKNVANSFAAPSNRLKGYLSDSVGGGAEDGMNNDPIADLFPHCTVMFADIAGFTAWSSTRDPAQVFVLLQTLYQAFDVIAKRRRVFKVETIGDSYVAVTGLPEPQPNHAVIMARFAGDCMTKMKELMSDLETTLGPDTGDLTVRIGLHSGPVTAGVLKGDRARFQLFGDTVNTAARMESTGVKDRIQISAETHDLLVAAGKSHWTRPRSDMVNAKGKGTLQTYWLSTYSKKATSASASSTTGGDSDVDSGGHATAGGAHPLVKPLAPLAELTPVNTAKQDRLIDWMVDSLKEQLKKLVAQRDGKTTSDYKPSFQHPEGTISLDEVAGVIHLPRLQSNSNNSDAKNFRDVEIDPTVQTQLREYVAIIASTYHSNPFHNFEHACHVTMATSKFIKRIVATTSEDVQNSLNNKNGESLRLYDYTHGINSDPLVVLAILFSALVHDADHRGVSNVQLGLEEPEMATFYQNKSIAEQNSLDIAWDLLLSDQFSALQRCLFTCDEELHRFRQVLVNVVLATDIFDKEINAMRKERWYRAFSEGSCSDPDINDLRATIVIEHIIQASDVAHTMQHWHVYRKWNKRLLHEMYVAYKAGRMGKNPCEFWYDGELGFFDNYIIPLAKKLKDCNVFGVSSDECLNYAIMNRGEWESRGQELVSQMAMEFEAGEFVE